MQDHDSIHKAALAEASDLAIEAVSNIRTIVGLGAEDVFISTYCQLLSRSHREAFRKNQFRALVYGFTQCVPFFAFAASMYYGGRLIITEGLDYVTVWKSVSMQLYSA